jgi:hypothetical protein
LEDLRIGLANNKQTTVLPAEVTADDTVSQPELNVVEINPDAPSQNSKRMVDNAFNLEDDWDILLGFSIQDRSISRSVSESRYIEPSRCHEASVISILPSTEIRVADPFSSHPVVDVPVGTSNASEQPLTGVRDAEKHVESSKWQPIERKSRRQSFGLHETSLFTILGRQGISGERIGVSHLYVQGDTSQAKKPKPKLMRAGKRMLTKQNALPSQVRDRANQ